jgi:L-alanine-DL-glutamate epimerase-like enolase superfamily enzyme
VRVSKQLIEARLRAPFVSASGSLSGVQLTLVRVQAEDGTVGYGESEELTRWDLEGRRAGEPVWRLLGAAAAPPVEVNATIATADPEDAGRQAAHARAAGFATVKVKVGLEGDELRLAAVRAQAGDQIAIRIDANGAWSVDQAISWLRALEPIGIECCEEPCRGLDPIAHVAAATSIPIAIDETAAQPGALDQRVCDCVCLKVARCGGIAATVEAARHARAAGYEVYLASLLDGPLGIAAALHAAAVIMPDRPCGLATLAMFEGREDPLLPRRGRIAMPDGPGLGDGLLGWYGV